jgi:hypothetical protein
MPPLFNVDAELPFLENHMFSFSNSCIRVLSRYETGSGSSMQRQSGTRARKGQIGLLSPIYRPLYTHIHAQAT